MWLPNVICGHQRLVHLTKDKEGLTVQSYGDKIHGFLFLVSCLLKIKQNLEQTLFEWWTAYKINDAIISKVLGSNYTIKKQ
jgi:hypothetical protein